MIEIEPGFSYTAEITLGIAINMYYEAQIKIYDKSAPNRYQLLIKSSKMGFIGREMPLLSWSIIILKPQSDMMARLCRRTPAGVGQLNLIRYSQMIVKDF